jgi:hypothetical protein
MTVCACVMVDIARTANRAHKVFMVCPQRLCQFLIHISMVRGSGPVIWILLALGGREEWVGLLLVRIYLALLSSPGIDISLSRVIIPGIPIRHSTVVWLHIISISSQMPSDADIISIILGQSRGSDAYEKHKDKKGSHVSTLLIYNLKSFIKNVNLE